MIDAILSHGSLRLESEDSLYDFIRKGTETNWEMFRLLEFVRFEYCSTDVMDNVLDLFSEHCYKITHQYGRAFALGSRFPIEPEDISLH
jgi:hypothetical protein